MIIAESSKDVNPGRFRDLFSKLLFRENGGDFCLFLHSLCKNRKDCSILIMSPNFKPLAQVHQSQNIHLSLDI